MKQTTKRSLVVAAVSALTLGAATGAFARGGFGPGWGGHHGMMGGGRMHAGFGGPGWMASADPVASAQKQLAELETTLAITPEQESAWTAYADAVTNKAALMASHREVMHAGALAPDQRLAFHQQGLEQMRKVITASDDLYAVLSPEQQAKATGLVGPRFGPRCAAR